jgi:hypothetical protein
MKTKVFILTLALGASTCLLTAQDGNPPRDGQRPAPREGGMNRDGGGSANAENLSNAQKAQVKAILSKYDAKALTAEQAKAIHEAFRQAGLRGGPAMADTIKAAGFDPLSMTGLPAAGRWVNVGPPLSANAPNSGSSGAAALPVLLFAPVMTGPSLATPISAKLAVTAP